MIRSVRVKSGLGPEAVEAAIQDAIDNCADDEEIEYDIAIESTVRIGNTSSTTCTLVIDVVDKEE